MQIYYNEFNKTKTIFNLLRKSKEKPANFYYLAKK